MLKHSQHTFSGIHEQNFYEQKTSLNKKTTVLAFSEITLSTSTNGKCTHRIRKLPILMLSSYFK